MAAHARPDLDLDAVSARLDALAAGCDGADLAALGHHLFTVERFTGNETDYYEPDNSFLDQVLERRTGIPLSLSLVTVLVGGRLGLDLGVVGMPGHVLVRDLGGSPGGHVFVDAFNGGVHLDAGGAQQLFAALHGDDAPFAVAYLDPLGPTAVLSRMLANLDGTYQAQGDRAGLTWVRRLRASIHTTDDRAHAALASALAAGGRFDQAAHAGIAGGYGDGTYRPRVEVRRDQMASFLTRLLDLFVSVGASTPPR